MKALDEGWLERMWENDKIRDNFYRAAERIGIKVAGLTNEKEMELFIKFLINGLHRKRVI